MTMQSTPSLHRTVAPSPLLIGRGRPWRAAVLLAALGTSLTACATSQPASVKGGECRVFTAPLYAIRGVDKYSQDWADDNTEAGIASCRWKRPARAPK